MKVRYHRRFSKQFRKLTVAQQNSFAARLDLFVKSPYANTLNSHALKGKFEGYRSINIGGDLRAVYKTLEGDIAFFTDIGSHSQLYD
ncbi:MAG: type II toxin-antitoxin system mRNA interferase toxin, RelE/StbE family [bacterium]|nr:type II toxin-antitoxin system mRNA interferase toxin, RelE/StbE family [bacterium]